MKSSKGLTIMGDGSTNLARRAARAVAPVSRPDLFASGRGSFHSFAGLGPLFCLLVLSFTCGGVLAQDFQWSWEDGEDGKAAANAPAEGKTVAPEGRKGYEWSWQDGKEAPKTVGDDKLPDEAVAGGSSVGARKSGPAADVGGTDGAAYQALLDDNLKLRRKIAEAERAGRDALEQNARLTREVKELEAGITESVAKIQDLKRAKTASSGNLDRVMELEGRLSEAESEKARLGAELAALRKRAAAAGTIQPSAVTETEEIAAAVGGAAGPAPREGSDLFRELEKENRILKRKWVEIEAGRQDAEKALREMSDRIAKAEQEAAAAGARELELKRQLDQVETDDARGKKEFRILLKRIPVLEKELQAKSSEAAEKETELEEKERRMKALMVELERREDRLVKAERMQQILEQAREELRRVSDAEKRDMHYNMAAVYARDGKFRLAEQEYLRALQVDPNDAGVHYNLGILYDDELNDKDRAAIHYRKYLQLNPYGSDVDEVKGWLMQIEMN